MDLRQCPNCIPQNILVDWAILLPAPAQSGIRQSHRGPVGDRSTIGLAPAPSPDPPVERTTQSSLLSPDSKTEHAASPRCSH